MPPLLFLLVGCGKSKPAAPEDPLAKWPTTPEVRRLYDEALESRHSNPDGASEQFAKAIELDAGFVPAYRERGKLLAERGHDDEVFRNIAALRKIDLYEADQLTYFLTTWSAPIIFEADQAFENEDYDSALKLYDRYIMYSNDSPDGYIGRGNVLALRGELDESIKSYDMAIKHDFRSITGLKKRAEVYAKKEQWQLAKDDLTKAFEFQPDDASILDARADVLDAMGDSGSAASDRANAELLRK